MRIFDEIKLAFQKSDNTINQLIIINAIVFVVLVLLYVILSISGQEAIFAIIYDQFSLPPSFAEFITKPWTLFTTFFTHSLSDIFHIVFNMLFLYWFGRIISDFIGSKKLLSIYILGGIAGGVLYLLMYNFIPFFIERQPSGLVGASSSIYAIMVASATLLPDYELRLFIFGRIKLVWLVSIYVFVSYLGLIGSNAGGEMAHIGGAILGYFYIKQLQKGNDWSKPVIKVLYWFRDLFKPKPKIKVSYRANKSKKEKNSTNVTSGKKPNQDQIDRILDKISESGYESLSKEEKQLLFQASE